MTPFETWLVLATQGLSFESATQVRAEIQEHYQSAHEAALASGTSAPDAERKAVTALGDPVAANWQYRRVLLTAREASHLKYMTLDPSALPPGRVKLGKWIAGVLIVEAFAGMTVVAWRVSAWWFVTLPLVALLLANQFLTIDTVSRGRAFRCAKWIAFIGGGTFAAWFGVKPAWVPLAILLVPAYMEYVRISIRRKLPVDQWPQRLYR